MAKGDTLILRANIYDQAIDDKVPPTTQRYEQGDSFEARTDEEYDRLTESGAAVDPKVENERAKEEAESRLEALKAEQERLQAEIDATETSGDLSSATKPELVKYLEANDLDTAGTKAELLERATAHQAATQE